MTSFSDRLRRLRREAGFSSAYQFYHRNGGRRHFPFTYVHYLRIERGVKLPKPEWLSRFLLALRLDPGQEACRELFLSYLRGLLRTQEAFDLVMDRLLSAAPARPPAGAAALRWLKEGHSLHLTPEQFRLLADDERAYWCSEVLLNDEGSWTARDLAGLLGFSSRDSGAALAKLKKAGLTRSLSGGRFRSRHPGKFYTFPGRVAGMRGALDAVQGHWERMFAKRGTGVSERVELVRAQDGAMRSYASVLAESLDGANGYATHAKAPGTGLFLIEARVRKLLDF